MVMQTWSWLAVLIAITGALPASAQRIVPSTSMTGGETPAPGTSGTDNSVNPTGNKDAVPLPAALPPAPAQPVKPGMSADEARQKLAAGGMEDVAGLYPDVDGTWRGVATLNGRKVMAWIDLEGGVGSKPLESGPDGGASR